ncbi:hypothetical protein [Desulfotomaculum copahuensis]|nr:hypothetical protein [Desulfotomaculum copahuensis]
MPKKLSLPRLVWRRRPETQVAPDRRKKISKYACRKSKSARGNETRD